MAPQIGESLRDARARQGIELDDVQHATKIRARYLDAMERERWDLLPDPAYVRGFLHTYADFLGLDADALAQEYARSRDRAEQRADAGEPLAPASGESVADSLTEPLITHAPGSPGARLRVSAPVLAALAAAAVIGFLVVLGLTGGSENGGNGRSRQQGASAPRTQSPTTAPAEQAPISVRLDPTGTVWVCLVNGETLTSGEARGPFRAKAFKVTFGNGEVQMEVDGKPFQVPPVAEPVAYSITPTGVQKLTSSAQ